MTYKDTYKQWITNPYFDEETKNELKQIANDEKEIEERFYRELEFGTGGLRGILGAGTNRVNAYTIRKATQGLANFIIKEQGEDKGVAIAYDSRNMSPELALETAKCLVANGIKTYLFTSLRPTPMLSFAVRELKCIAGIVITASHNPPEYNGYKVYWEDGAQVTPPKDGQIIAEVNAITDYTSPLSVSKEEALNSGRLIFIDKAIDDRYFEELKKEVSDSEMIREHGSQLRIVYTPLHGSGVMPTKRILKELGFTDVHVVKEQEEPDGDFPTLVSPNPEDKRAFTLAIELAKKVDADVILATDPDADRLGIYAKDQKTNEYVAFNGNMSAAIILEYLLAQRKVQKTLPENGAVVTTIVSGNLGKEIAKSYDMKVFETLTGFKYIGEMIRIFEQTKEYQFQFGYEESYGCLLGTYARDKDAIVAVMALCEAALYYKMQGLTLCDQLEELYQAYGYYHEDLGTVTLSGKEGSAKIQEIMTTIRQNPPTTVGDYQVVNFCDYAKDVKNSSNVLFFGLSDNAWCCVRPSGTEPKIKFYVGVKGCSSEESQAKGDNLLNVVKQWVE
jgi:Phosphomannomutase